MTRPRAAAVAVAVARWFVNPGGGGASCPARAAGARQASTASRGSSGLGAPARAGTLTVPTSDGEGHPGTPASAFGFAAAAAASTGEGVSSGPLAELQRRVSVGQLVGGDARQMEAVVALQALRDSLVANPPGGPPPIDDAGFAARWLEFTGLRGGSGGGQGTQGVYLHGGVGRGKTMVMDMFYVGPGSYCSPRHPTHFEPSSS